MNLFIFLNFIALTCAVKFHIDTKTTQFRDEYFRERYFHGTNVVFKGPPFVPVIDRFDPFASFSVEDMDLMQEIGLNVVRFGIMFPGVEPTSNTIDWDYIEKCQWIVHELEKRNISVIIEFHQDVLANRFCGEGLPEHAVRGRRQKASAKSFPKPQNYDSVLQRADEHGFSDKSYVDQWLAFIRETNPDVISATVPDLWHDLFSQRASGAQPLNDTETVLLLDYFQNRLEKYMEFKSITAGFPIKWPKLPNERVKEKGFPSPVYNSYELDDHGLPNEIDCFSKDWVRYHFAYETAQAYQDLYDDFEDSRKDFERYWSTLVINFKKYTNILGYELINEPFSGNIYSNPLLLVPGVPDKINLAKFFGSILTNAIRKYDKERIAFISTITWDSFVPVGFRELPDEKQYTNLTALAYHYYELPNFNINLQIKSRIKDMKRLGGIGGFISEFETNPKERLLKQIEAADRYLQSFANWEFKIFHGITGANHGLFNSESVADENGDYILSDCLNNGVVATLARTYPQAVAGRTQSYSYNNDTAEFNLVYKPTTSEGNVIVDYPTEIYLSESINYRRKFTVEVEDTGLEAFGLRVYWEKAKKNMIYIWLARKENPLQYQMPEMHTIRTLDDIEIKVKITPN